MIYLNNLLFYIFFIPLLGSVFLIFVSFKYSNFLKSVCLSTASLTFLLSLILCFFFDKSSAIFQFETNQIWFLDYSMIFSFGIDGVSLFFVILTTMLIPICLLISWNSFTYLLKTVFTFIFNYGVNVNWCFLYFGFIIVLYFF